MNEEQLREKYLARIAGLERDLMKARRAEKVLREVERRYLSLMESGLFLFMVLAPSGRVRFLNRRAEEFFGFHLNPGTKVTLQSLVSPGYAEEAESVLTNSAQGSCRITLPVNRASGSLGWLDAEFTWSAWHGEPSILFLGADVTKLATSGANAWPQRVLDCCPGLLCFSVDRDGILLSVTRGYQEIAGRFLGHDCVCGSPYPVRLETAFDMDLDELIRGAFEGGTSMTTLTEKVDGGIICWSVTAAPVMRMPGSESNQNITGAVVNLIPLVRYRPKTKALPAPESPPVKVAAVPPASGDDIFNAAFMDSVHQMLLLLDDVGTIIEANAHFLKTTKFERNDLVGRSFVDLALPGDPLNGDLKEKIRILADGAFLNNPGDNSNEIDCKICGRDGEVFSLRLCAARPHRGKSSPRSEALLVTCTDTTKLRRMEEQLQRMSATDASTGTLNRIGIERVLGDEAGRSLRYGFPLALIVLDIDGFRALNERIGYAACDRILKEVATVLKSGVRSTDYLGCRGGDEFMVLTPSTFSAACDLAESLRVLAENQIFGRTFGKAYGFSGDIRLTFSIGVAEFRREMDISAFVTCAWEAMMTAKREGGNRVARTAPAAREGEPEEASF